MYYFGIQRKKNNGNYGFVVRLTVSMVLSVLGVRSFLVQQLCLAPRKMS